jgi:hypothetical protein
MTPRRKAFAKRDKAGVEEAKKYDVWGVMGVKYRLGGGKAPF